VLGPLWSILTEVKPKTRKIADVMIDNWNRNVWRALKQSQETM
jgi:hypothetical protein